MVIDLEVTASYWEARIKTYGFHAVTGLSLFDLTVDSGRLSLLGRALCRMGEEGIPLVLTFSCLTSEGLGVSFVVPRAFEGRVRDRLQEETGPGEKGMAGRASPVEVVYFYGPHFGDRSGIAETALNVLAGSGIRAKASACSGSCVYLVLPEGGSETAVDALSRTFEIPRAKSHKKAVGNPGVMDP